MKLLRHVNVTDVTRFPNSKKNCPKTLSLSLYQTSKISQLNKQTRSGPTHWSYQAPCSIRPGSYPAVENKDIQYIHLYAVAQMHMSIFSKHK